MQWINGGTDFTASVANQYDAYGNLTRMDSVNDNNVKDTWQSWVYGWKDQAVVASSTFDRSTFDSNNNLYSSSQTYDGLGRLQRATIADGKPRGVHFAVTPDNQILSRVQNDGSSDDPRDYHLYANGRQVAEYTSNANEDLRNYDYQQLILDKTSSASGSGDFWHGATTGTQGAETGTSGYDPINAITAGVGQSSRSRYIVQAGDTLQSIANALWGDSALWFRLAEANGLSGDSMLTAGQALSIPLKGPSNSNNASMFRPYDPASAVGDLSPTSVKPPKKNKCGAFGQVLLVAIAVAVTVVIAGPASAAIGAALNGGAAAAAGSAAAIAGGVAGGAVAGAAGSLVSQSVGLATGIQTKFDWKGVALSAISGGISGGLGASGILNGQTFGAGAARGVLSSVATQGIGVVTGLQKRFDWAGVAAAGIGGGVGQAIGGTGFMKTLPGFGQRMVSSMAVGIADAASRSVINGTDFADNLMAALPDVIGQTVGGAVADGVAGLSSDRQVNIPNGALGALMLAGDLGIVQMAEQFGTYLKQKAAEGVDALEQFLGVSDPNAIVVTGTRLPPKHSWSWKLFDTLGFHKGGFFNNLWNSGPGERVPVTIGRPTVRPHSPTPVVMTGISANNSILPYAYAYRVGEARATINAARANWDSGNYGRSILGYLAGNVQKGTILFSGTLDLGRARFFGRADPGLGDRQTTDLLLGVGGLAAGELGAVGRVARINPIISQPELYSLEAPIVHGNSKLSPRTAYLYELSTKEGEFLKYGVSQDLAARYPKTFMTDKFIEQIASGSRADMLVLERQMIIENPGPLNFEPWAVKAREGL